MKWVVSQSKCLAWKRDKLIRLQDYSGILLKATALWVILYNQDGGRHSAKFSEFPNWQYNGQKDFPHSSDRNQIKCSMCSNRQPSIFGNKLSVRGGYWQREVSHCFPKSSLQWLQGDAEKISAFVRRVPEAKKKAAYTSEVGWAAVWCDRSAGVVLRVCLFVPKHVWCNPRTDPTNTVSCMTCIS